MESDDIQQYILSVENRTKKILADRAKQDRERAEREKAGATARSRLRPVSVKTTASTTRSLSPTKYNGTATSSILRRDGTVDVSKLTWDGSFSTSRRAPTTSLKSKTNPLPRVTAVLKSMSPKKRNISATSGFSKRLMKSPLRTASMRKTGTLVHTCGRGGHAGKRHRAEHAVQKSHCKACWSNPDVVVGTEVGMDARERRTERESKRNVAQQLQRQGPTSWSYYNMRRKYRDEESRNAAWRRSEAAQEAARREKEELGRVIPVVIVTRHPLHVECDTEVIAMNKSSVERSVARNKLKTFCLSMKEVWTAHPPEIPTNDDADDDDNDDGRTDTKRTRGTECLPGRWDIASIESGHHQVQSVSLKKALSTASVSPLQALTRSVREVQMARLRTDFVTHESTSNDNDGDDAANALPSSSASSWTLLDQYDVEFKNMWFEVNDVMDRHGIERRDTTAATSKTTHDETIACKDNSSSCSNSMVDPTSVVSPQMEVDEQNEDDLLSTKRRQRRESDTNDGAFALLDSASSQEELSSDDEEEAANASADAAEQAMTACREAKCTVRDVCEVVDAMYAAKTASRISRLAVSAARDAAVSVVVNGWRTPPPRTSMNDTRRARVSIYLSDHHVKVEFAVENSKRTLSTILSRSVVRETLRNDPQFAQTNEDQNKDVDVGEYIVSRMLLMRHIDDGHQEMAEETAKRHEGGSYFDEETGELMITTPLAPPPSLIFDDNHPSLTPNSFWSCGRCEAHNMVPGTTVLGKQEHLKQNIQLVRRGVSPGDATVLTYEFLYPQLVTACFRRDGRRYNSIVVNLSSSLEVPLFHPLCGAWDDEILKPVPLAEGRTELYLSKAMSPCIHRRVDSVVDVWTPPPSLALTNAVTNRDVDPLVEGHLRWSYIRDQNGFRLIRVFDLDQVNPNIPVRTYGVSEPAALPNVMCAWPRRYSYHLDYVCTELMPHWSKDQTMAMLRAVDAAGPNESLVFQTHMSEYACDHVSKEKRCDQLKRDEENEREREVREAKVRMAKMMDGSIRKREQSALGKDAIKRNLELKERRRATRLRGKIPNNLKESEWIKRADDATVIGRQKIERSSTSSRPPSNVTTSSQDTVEEEWIMLQKDDLVFYRMEGGAPGAGYQWDPPKGWRPVGAREPSSARSEVSSHPAMSLAPDSARVRDPRMMLVQQDRSRSGETNEGDARRGVATDEDIEKETNNNTIEDDEDGEEVFEDSSSSSDESEWEDHEQDEEDEKVPEHLDELMHTLVQDERFLGTIARRFGVKILKEELPEHSQYRIGMKVEARLGGGNDWWPCTISNMRPDGSLDLVYDLPNTVEQFVEQEFVRLRPIKRSVTRRKGRKAAPKGEDAGQRSQRRRGKKRNGRIANANDVSEKIDEEDDSVRSGEITLPALRLDEMDIPGYKPANETARLKGKGMQPRNEREEVLQLLEHHKSNGCEDEELLQGLHLKNWRLMRASAVPKGFVTKALATHTVKPYIEPSSSTPYYKSATPSMPGMYDPALDSYKPKPDIVPTRTEIVADVMKDTLKFSIEQKARNGGIASPDTKTNAASLGIALGDEENDPEVQLAEWKKKCFTAVRNASMAEVEEYLDYGVNCQDAFDENGNTLLHVAVQQGLKGITKLLLRRMADINAKNHAGNTPLHYAFEYNFDELGEYLISKGADPTIQNAQGLTCYEGLHMSDLEDL